MSNTAKHPEHGQAMLTEVEQDIIASAESRKLAILDEIEAKADILDGSLAFAMDAASDGHAGFYLGLKEQVSGIVALLDKLRR